MDILISGIPKGLNPALVAKYIRKRVETVAQVNDIRIYAGKGRGFITLFDETSTECVLAMNNDVHINGSYITFQRKGGACKKKYTQLLKTKSSVSDRRGCASLSVYGAKPEHPSRHNQMMGSNIGGYKTYWAYHDDQPSTDTLYSILQQEPPRRRKRRKRPWTGVNSSNVTPTPSSRKSTRIKKSHQKKRKEPRHTNNPPRKENITPERQMSISKNDSTKTDNDNTNVTDISLCLLSGHDKLRTEYPTKDSVAKYKGPLSTSLTTLNEQENHDCDESLNRATVNIHFYDHQRYLFSHDVDQNNTIENVTSMISKRLIMPSSSYMLSYNGKLIHRRRIPKLENNGNIHIIVKGKGGMRKSDPKLQQDKIKMTDIRTSSSQSGNSRGTDGHTSSPQPCNSSETDGQTSSPQSGQSRETDGHTSSPRPGNHGEIDCHTSSPQPGNISEVDGQTLSPQPGNISEVDGQTSSPQPGNSNEAYGQTSSPQPGNSSEADGLTSSSQPGYTSEVDGEPS